MIGIVECGVGNAGSIQSLLSTLGLKSVRSSDPKVLRSASRLILPGVGNFSHVVTKMRESGLWDELDRMVMGSGVPILGICLGAQLLGLCSAEGGAQGFGWIDMTTVAFDRGRLGHGEKVPHMGWANTRCSDHPLFRGFSEYPPRFYYVHSYHFSGLSPGTIICECDHGYTFPAGVARKHIVGVQFHPEKSHSFGRQFLKNWASMEFQHR